MAKLKALKEYVFLLMLAGIGVLYHQNLTAGTWFDPNNIYHETVALVFFSAAGTLFYVWRKTRGRR